MLFDLVLFEIFFQVDRVRRSDTRPNDIDHVNVDISALGGPILLVLLQSGRSVVRTTNVFERVPGLLRPLFREGLRPSSALTDVGVAGKMDRNTSSLQHGRQEKCSSRCQERFGQNAPVREMSIGHWGIEQLGRVYLS